MNKLGGKRPLLRKRVQGVRGTGGVNSITDTTITWRESSVTSEENLKGNQCKLRLKKVKQR